jgi:hypothetical protein
LSLIVLMLAVFLAWSHVAELRDTSVASNIIHEAGRGYIVQSYLAMTIAVGLPLVGAIVSWRKSA